MRARLGARKLLRECPAFRNLCIALSLSAIGTGAATTALVLYVQSTRGTGIAVAVFLIAITLPRLLGPLAGSLVDRLDLRTLLIGCDAGQAVLFVGLALLPPFPAILALSAGTAVLAAGYSPARGTSLPALVGDQNLLGANALVNTALNLQVAVGPVVGGLLVALGGTGVALGINAATFAASALICTSLPSLPAQAQSGPSGMLASARQGVRYLFSDPVLRVATISLFAVVAFAGVDEVALVFLVRDTLDGGAVAFGLVSAGFGVGLIVAAVRLTRGTTMPAGTIYCVGMALTGAGILLTGLAPILLAAFAFQILAGTGNGMDNIAHDTLMQQLVPRPMLGRVFGTASSAAYAGAGISAAIGGVLVDVTSPRAVFIGAGIGTLVTVALASRRLRGTGARVAV